jgi:programmed cell death 8 (apoptosis-inducing factor)
VIFFEKCLLATGSSPHRLREYVGGRLVNAADELPFEPNSPISALRDASDYLRLRRVMTQAKHVAVIGGGVPAAELAVGLRRAYPDVRVSMLFKEDLVLDALVPSDVAQKVTAEVLRHGVEVHPATRVEVLDRSRPEKPVVIFTSDELQAPIEADHVVLAVGEKPATRFAEMAQLELDKSTGGIVVNQELAARSDIYAAGDVACYYDPKLSLRTRTSSYDHAAMSGRAAGRNMTGLREVYEHTPMFWSQIGDLRFESVGRIDSKLQTVGVWDEAGRELPTDSRKARGVVYYIDSNRIVGVLLCNVDGQVENARAIVQRRKLYYDKKILMSMLSIEHGEHQL